MSPKNLTLLVSARPAPPAGNHAGRVESDTPRAPTPPASRLVVRQSFTDSAARAEGPSPVLPPAFCEILKRGGDIERKSRAHHEWEIERTIEALCEMPRAYLADIAKSMLQDSRLGSIYTDEQREARRRLAITIKVCAARHPGPNGVFDPPARSDLVEAMRAATVESLNRRSRHPAFHPFFVMNVVVPVNRSIKILAHLVASGDLDLGIDKQVARFLARDAAALESSNVTKDEGPDGQGAASSSSQVEIAFSSLLVESIEARESQKNAFVARLRARVVEEQVTDELRAKPGHQAPTLLCEANLALIETVRRQIEQLRSMSTEQLSEQDRVWFRGQHRNLSALAAMCRDGIASSRRNLRSERAAARQGLFDEAAAAVSSTVASRNLVNATECRQRIETIKRQVANAIEMRPLPAGFQVPSVLIDWASRAQEACRAQRVAAKAVGGDAGHERKVLDLSRRLGGHIRRLKAIDLEARSADILWVYLEALAARAEELAEAGEKIALDLKLAEALAHLVTARQAVSEEAAAQHVQAALLEEAQHEAAEQAPAAEGSKEAHEEVTNQDLDLSAAASAGASVSGQLPRLAGGAVPSESWIEARFARGTFPSARASALYHFRKHGQHTTGQTLVQYIEGAQRACAQFTGLVERSMSRPGEFLRLVDSRDTYLLFTKQGRIVSYRDRRS